MKCTHTHSTHHTHQASKSAKNEEKDQKRKVEKCEAAISKTETDKCSQWMCKSEMKWKNEMSCGNDGRETKTTTFSCCCGDVFVVDGKRRNGKNAWIQSLTKMGQPIQFLLAFDEDSLSSSSCSALQNFHSHKHKLKWNEQKDWLFRSVVVVKIK